MSQEYLDMMMPIDYTPEAFQYVNRRSYDKWRMVGMQFSHTFVGGVTAIGEDNYMFNAGRLKGFTDGCKVVEEVNQNNQIIGRGGWYFRAKRAEAEIGVHVPSEGGIPRPEKYFDITSLNETGPSAVYGIMGHCAQVDAEREVTGADNPGIEEIEGITYNSTWASLVYTPMRKNWGVPQGYEMCACAGQNSEWAMMAFIEVLDTVSGQKKYFMQSTAGDPNAEGNTQSIKAQLSRGPGFFSAWYYLGGGNTRIYRTCEAHLWIQNGIGMGVDTQPRYAQDLCLDYSDSAFNSNIYPDIANQYICNIVDGEAVTPGPEDDVPLTFYDDWRGPIKISQMYAGVLIKLTSLPSCAHHDKLIKRTRTKFANNTVGREKTDICLNAEYDGYDPTQPFCTETLRCERAVIRIMPVCGASIGYKSPFGSDYTVSNQWPTIEKHFDRWDKALNGNYKVFDELFDIPEARMRVRVISHNYKELQKIYADSVDPTTLQLTEASMNVQYLTGGDESGVVGGPRGCSCTPKKQEENYFPIRPYNIFKYCANDFSCEKEC